MTELHATEAHDREPGRRQTASAAIRRRIIRAARDGLLTHGYAALTTRRVAELADVPLSQIHYHVGSRQALMLAVLAEEDRRLLDRQRAMFAGDAPLWERWERACTFLDDDIASGYVRILQELIAAGWSDEEIAPSVRALLDGWFGLLADVARREAERGTSFGPFSVDEIAALMGVPFLGAEQLVLLGVRESRVPIRSALRKVGLLLRALDASGAPA